jgi:hypothetical protein
MPFSQWSNVVVMRIVIDRHMHMNAEMLVDIVAHRALKRAVGRLSKTPPNRSIRHRTGPFSGLFVTSNVTRNDAYPIKGLQAQRVVSACHSPREVASNIAAKNVS